MCLKPQARENLLALLKHMYRQLFAWINWKINVVFDIPAAAAASAAGKGAERTFIGILDIFGEREIAVCFRREGGTVPDCSSFLRLKVSAVWVGFE